MLDDFQGDNDVPTIRLVGGPLDGEVYSYQCSSWPSKLGFHYWEEDYGCTAWYDIHEELGVGTFVETEKHTSVVKPTAKCKYLGPK